MAKTTSIASSPTPKGLSPTWIIPMIAPSASAASEPVADAAASSSDARSATVSRCDGTANFGGRSGPTRRERHRVRANLSRPIVLGYLGVGLLLADLDSYLQDLSVVRAVVSASLAVCFWPLLLLGIDLHVRHVG